MGLALNLRQIVGQLLQLDVIGNGPQLKHNAGTMEMRNSTDTGFVITRGSDPVGNNDFVTKGAGDLAYWRSVNPNWLVTDWYIDGVTGDDTNSGTVIGSPIKTGAELLRRLGPYAMWPQSVTVHVLANGMIDALILRGAMMVAGTHLDVIGTPTQLADAGTVATYAAVNHATPVATQITATGIVDWTPYHRCRIRVTAGVRTGAVTWIDRANPAGTGLATARVSPPIQLNTASTTSYRSSVALVIGDPIVIESLPSVPAITLYIDGPLSFAVTPLWSRRLTSVRDLRCADLTCDGTGSNRGPSYLPIFGCQLSYIQTRIDVLASASGPTEIVGSLLMQDDPATTIYRQTGIFFACLFGQAATTRMVPQGSLFAQNCLWGGISLNIFTYQFVGSGVQFFDCPVTTPALVFDFGRISGGVSGNGNLGVGLGLPNNASCTITGTQNLQGAISNGQLTAVPVINLTITQLLQPSDYAQKGITPAMVAGTTTVTVPWYDNAAQRVTVSHAAFAGTPGILSVQQISNTQFTITSSSALDTSTVNWSISPLGRNIFISTV